VSTFDVQRCLYARLATDTTLNGKPAPGPIPSMLGGTAAGYAKNIYYGQAPEDAGYPFIVFQRQASTPQSQFVGMGADASSELWAFQTVAEADSIQSAAAANARVNALLHDWIPGTASLSPGGGGTAVYLRRESDIAYSEVLGGVTYHHIGTVFRLERIVTAGQI
jgi:hypothetical protein